MTIIKTRQKVSREEDQMRRRDFIAGVGAATSLAIRPDVTWARDAPAHEARFYRPDKFVPVRDTSQPPYPCIGQMTITFPSRNRFIGTGFMIGPRHCLTAGHNVYRHNEGGYATRVLFKAGHVDANNLLYAVARNRPDRRPAFHNGLLSLALYRGRPDFDWDIGLVLLDRELGIRTGVLEFGIVDDNILSQSMSVAGYPDFTTRGQEMWVSSGPVLETSSERIFSDNYGFHGMSGGPLYGSNNKVYGVNVGVGPKGAIACRFTQGKLNRINFWLTLK